MTHEPSRLKTRPDSITNPSPGVILDIRQPRNTVQALEAIRKEVARLGPDNVLAIMTCTRYIAIFLLLLISIPSFSCFAPRGPDDLPGVAQICQEVSNTLHEL